MVKVVYTRKETLPINRVRKMCVSHNFYTRGTNDEYERMFELCCKYSGSDDELVHIAWDIVSHSDEDELEDYGFETVYEAVAYVAHLLIQECMWTSVDVSEEEN